MSDLAERVGGEPAEGENQVRANGPTAGEGEAASEAAPGRAEPLIPARILNEHVYCPRLAYLEWVQGEWAENADTLEGHLVHRSVDVERGNLPEPTGWGEGSVRARSVTLSSERLGIVARIDLVEGEGGAVRPVDFKKGRRPHVARGAYDPERVQLCAQGLLLREHGYACEEGFLYYAESRERVRVPFDDELIAMTLRAIEEVRANAKSGRIPPPLVDSPKCPRCALVSICLPDETIALREGEGTARPLAVAHEVGLPLHVQEPGARLSRRGEEIEITRDGTLLATVRMREISSVSLYGPIHVSAAALVELLRRGISVCWLSSGGWLQGLAVGMTHRNVELRAAQYRASFDPEASLRIARVLVADKILNSRVLLRRNWKRGDPPRAAFAALRQLAARARRADSREELLGLEGQAAAVYFRHLAGTFSAGPLANTFAFDRRNRRPPTDPVNAMLSLAYAVLVRSMISAVLAAGFDPFRGFYHQPRYGRPSLALDLAEPFRPILADSTVIQVINNRELGSEDFIRRGEAANLTTEGRRRFLAALERRLGLEVTHPVLGYRLSYRRLLELHARLLGRHLLGELKAMPSFVTR